MKSYDNDEDLERALFALDLEEPPADLRTSILAATIYRVPVPVRPWEIWALGALCALLAWIAVLSTHSGSVPAFTTFETYLAAGLATLAKPEILFWTAIGGSLAIWISQLNLTTAPGALRVTRR